MPSFCFFHDAASIGSGKGSTRITGHASSHCVKPMKTAGQRGRLFLIIYLYLTASCLFYTLCIGRSRASVIANSEKMYVVLVNCIPIIALLSGTITANR